LSIQFVVKITACLALAGASSLISVAQQTTPPASPDSSAPTQQQSTTQPTAPGQQPASSQTSQPQSSPQSDKDKNPPNTSGKVEGTSNDRLFYTLPNFLTLQNGGKLPPLSTKDKFKVVALGSFDPVEFPWWGILAAISQAENSEPAYGQGWKAYAKRYGTTAGDSLVENFMVGAVFPSVLHQDPRFYYSEKGGFARRAGYAVSRIFVTRTDSGHAQFNFSEIFGAATAATISTYTYHPSSTTINGKFIGSDKTVSNTLDVYGTQLTLDTITLVVKEFWPDIHRKMAKKHKAEAAH
jgi:hypothetical protein